MWDVEYTNEFGQWWNKLNQDERASVQAYVNLLKLYGPQLQFPYCSGINGSRHHNMRELRVQHKGNPYRILYAFDPNRTAICLFGGKKTGNNRWYKKSVPVADLLYNEHLQFIEELETYDSH